ncbi:MAG: TetR/AcrR family transcriptional regulator [Pseudomonadota bacterium]
MKKIKLSSRKAIIEAAFQTYSQRPGASLGDIAEYAGVGRATLHRHFSSRKELMAALAKTAIEELNECVEAATIGAQSHTEGLKLALAAIIPLANRQWFLSHEPVDDNQEIVAIYEAHIAELHSEIEAARAEGTFAPDLSTRWISEVYENLIYTAWTMVREDEATSSQAAEIVWRIFMKGASK